MRTNFNELRLALLAAEPGAFRTCLRCSVSADPAQRISRNGRMNPGLIPAMPLVRQARGSPTSSPLR